MNDHLNGRHVDFNLQSLIFTFYKLRLFGQNIPETGRVVTKIMSWTFVYIQPKLDLYNWCCIPDKNGLICLSIFQLTHFEVLT